MPVQKIIQDSRFYLVFKENFIKWNDKPNIFQKTNDQDRDNHVKQNLNRSYISSDGDVSGPTYGAHFDTSFHPNVSLVSPRRSPRVADDPKVTGCFICSVTDDHNSVIHAVSRTSRIIEDARSVWNYSTLVDISMCKVQLLRLVTDRWHQFNGNWKVSSFHS